MRYPDIDPVLLAVGPLQLRWYGLMYLVGFALAWWLLQRRVGRRSDLDWRPEAVSDLIFYCALGVIVGGRVGYLLFYGFAEWLADPLRLLRVWEGGMSFHGGLIGVLIAVAWFARRQRRAFFSVTDLIAPVVPVGLGAGRIGNFINGELWGGPAATGLPWGMQLDCRQFGALCYDKLGLPVGTPLTPPLHPSQLYEAALEGLVLFVLLWWYSAQPRPRMAVSAWFLIGYGVFRFLVELVRLPDTHLGYLAFGWLTMGQLLSAPMVLAGLVMWYWALRRQRSPGERDEAIS